MPASNYAFIDSQNVNLGVRSLGWSLDWRRFRLYLRQRYGVARAYLFLGFVPKNQPLYESLQRDGYELIFKPVTYAPGGKAKGNVDAELVLQACAIDYEDYDRAVIVTSDGDFACLVHYLCGRGKLRVVLSPSRDNCSVLLRRAAQKSIRYLDQLRPLLEFRK